jgi:antitoxin component of RelBE/YafQ-DinJ toxin-antitoxin module
VLFRCRVKKPLLEKVDKVSRSLGTSTGEMVRIFMTEIARTGRVPLNLQVPDNADVLPLKEQRNQTMRSLDDTESW